MCRTLCSTFPQCEFNRDLLLHVYLQRYYFVIYNRNTDIDHYYLWYIDLVYFNTIVLTLFNMHIVCTIQRGGGGVGKGGRNKNNLLFISKTTHDFTI